MRTGERADSETEGQALLASWVEGLRVAAERARAQGIPERQIGFAANPAALAAHYYDMRRRLYTVEPRFQSVTEAFVVFG